MLASSVLFAVAVAVAVAVVPLQLLLQLLPLHIQIGSYVDMPIYLHSACIQAYTDKHAYMAGGVCASSRRGSQRMLPAAGMPQAVFGGEGVAGIEDFEIVDF